MKQAGWTPKRPSVVLRRTDSSPRGRRASMHFFDASRWQVQSNPVCPDLLVQLNEFQKTFE